MMPAQPPPPTNWNLPFQLSGSHGSISISESGDGRRIALTRQCGGTICGAGAPGPPGPRPRPSGTAAGAGAAPRPGCTNGPAATISAAMIVVFGTVSDFSASQDAGEEAIVPESASAKIIATSTSVSLPERKGPELVACRVPEFIDQAGRRTAIASR